MLIKRYPYITLPKTEVNGKRLYNTPTGNLPSVTTILDITKSEAKKDVLKEWRERIGNKNADIILQNSVDVGTLVHTHLENYILDKPRPAGSNIIRKTAQIVSQSIIDNGLKNVQEFWGTEISLYYDSIYAGTTDCAGLYKNLPSIIDFKNTRRVKKDEWVDDYKLQLAAYGESHNKMFGTNINSGIIMMANRDPNNLGDYQEWFITGKDYNKAVYNWWKRVELYYQLTT